jgi:co-chaperonin GroES (HSP10)
MIRPLAKNMLIKKVKEEKKSILILSTSTTGPFKAILISKGKQVDLDVEIGDILLVNQFGPMQFDKEDDEHFLVTERDILGAID